jgi:hypothetical protein
MRTFIVALAITVAVIPSWDALASCSTITGPGMPSGGPCPAPRAIPRYNAPRTTTYSVPSLPSGGINAGAVGAAVGLVGAGLGVLSGLGSMLPSSSGPSTSSTCGAWLDREDELLDEQKRQIQKTVESLHIPSSLNDVTLEGSCQAAEFLNWKLAYQRTVMEFQQSAAAACPNNFKSDFSKPLATRASWEAEFQKFTQWCNHYRAQMTPAPVPVAAVSPSSENVYLSCQEKRRAGYVLAENEIDYCCDPGAAKVDRRSAKAKLRDEISRKLALAAKSEDPAPAVRQQCKNAGVLVPNCYDSIVDGQCWRQTLGNSGWDPTPIPIDQCPAEVRQNYCAEYSEYDKRTCPPTRVAAVAPSPASSAAPEAPPFEECTEARGVQTCYTAPRFGYSCTIEHRQNGATIWSGTQERCDSDFLLRRNAYFNRYPDPNATPAQRFTMPADETTAEIRRFKSDLESR